MKSWLLKLCRDRSPLALRAYVADPSSGLEALADVEPLSNSLGRAADLGRWRTPRQSCEAAASSCGSRIKLMVLNASPMKLNFLENSDAIRVSAVAKKICRPEFTARSRR